MSISTPYPYGLYNSSQDSGSCGVGFITRKDGKQTHEILQMAHGALCTIPHRGGISAEGVGDGAGINIDLSLRFFCKLTRQSLEVDRFGVGNFFVPKNTGLRANAKHLVEETLASRNFPVIIKRNVPLNNSVIRPAAVQFQLPIVQWVFAAQSSITNQLEFEKCIYSTLRDIEERAFTQSEFEELYPISLSSRTQVLKARLNSNEVIPYFRDLTDEDHQIRDLLFHTRFSTNTDPHTTMAQPFRIIAHNGELNTDRKNRIAESALALARGKNRTSKRSIGQCPSRSEYP